MRHIFRLLRFALVGLAIGLVPAVGPAAAADCPNNLTFEPTGSATADAGWTGQAHGLDVVGSTLRLAVSCSASTSPCGTCPITGLAGGNPQRCSNDTRKTCTPATEVTVCGGVGRCRALLSPPQSASLGGIAFCFLSTVGTGNVSGTVDVESGALTLGMPVRADMYSGVSSGIGGPNQGCPQCVNDTTPNDGAPNGQCDSGLHAGQSCDANAVSALSDFGATSFDCPPTPGAFKTTFTFGALPASTEAQTMTLSAGSPPCSSGNGKKCFCGTCNNLGAEPCAGNADCPVSGGNPGICDGKRCIGGSNNGAPCAMTSECPGGGICGKLGEPTKPSACLDDTANPNDACADTGGGIGRCTMGPIASLCTNHPNRTCTSDAQCDNVFGACMVVNRRCFLDNGIVGNSLSVTGTATPPTLGIADPTVLGVLGCAPATGSSEINSIGGFAGPVRSLQPGRLTLTVGALPTVTPVPTVTPTPTPIPDPCSASPAVCRAPYVVGKSSLQITDKSPDDKDKLAWKWNRGAATGLADFGDPTTSDEYALCLYDGGALVSTMQIPAGGTCDGKPCWSATNKGFRYRDKSADPHGITQVILSTGQDGKAQIRVKGQGTLLPLPPVAALTSTQDMQLRNRASGLCWGTTFVPPFDKVTATLLKDKDD